MGAIDGKTIQSGDRVWVELPPEFGFPADMPIRVQGDRTGVTIKPRLDPVEEKRKLTELMDELRAIGPVGEIEVRDSDIFPDRPGL